MSKHSPKINQCIIKTDKECPVFEQHLGPNLLSFKIVSTILYAQRQWPPPVKPLLLNKLLYYITVQINIQDI